jgi:hypothetical protein
MVDMMRGVTGPAELPPVRMRREIPSLKNRHGKRSH